jgi:hypothetical protein
VLSSGFAIKVFHVVSKLSFLRNHNRRRINIKEFHKMPIFKKVCQQVFIFPKYLCSMKTLEASVLVAILGILVLFAVMAPDFAYSAKNPQAECIKGQNQGFIGNEQKGDAYEFSKDTCQTLSK